MKDIYSVVSFCKDQSGNERIRAHIRVNNKLINMGSFKSEEDAARAYDAMAIKYHGEFANPNFKT